MQNTKKYYVLNQDCSCDLLDFKNDVLTYLNINPSILNEKTLNYIKNKKKIPINIINEFTIEEYGNFRW